LRAPAVSVARRPAQLLGLLVLREGRGCPAGAQACAGHPMRPRPTASRRPTTGGAWSWTSRKATTSRSGRRLRGTVRLLRRLSRAPPPDPIHGFVRSQTAAVAVRRVGRRDHLRPYRAPPPQGAPAPGTARGRGRLL